jgi:hypothetical protein
VRALQIQRLEGSRPAIGRGLWVLYVVEQVMMVRGDAVAVCAWPLSGGIVEKRAALSWLVEAEGKTDSVSWAR